MTAPGGLGDRARLPLMTDPVRIGVIGAGSFGQQHIRAYARNIGVEIVGIADRDADRARSVAARWGISNWYGDGLAMLRSCRPDGVSVATPAGHHLEPTLAALAQGCSVLLEKPVALSGVDVATIVDAAHASKGFVMPAHILRFAAPYIELRGRLHGGAIGTLLGISAVRDRGRGHAQLFPDIHPALMTAIPAEHRPRALAFGDTRCSRQFARARPQRRWPTDASVCVCRSCRWKRLVAPYQLADVR